MSRADNPAGRAGQLSAEIVVVGAGVAGLWTALKAARGGAEVLLIEKDGIGAGASGGFLGALMPYMPENWDAKKAFQFRALELLEAETARLYEETGLSPGYGRVGRLMPLADARQEKTARMRTAAARENWEDRYSFELHEGNEYPDWFSPEDMAHGTIMETLTARLSPPGLLAALAAAFSVLPNARIVAGEATSDIDARAGTLRLADGTTVRFGHLVLANGVGTAALIEPLLNWPPNSLGSAVKGQAALLDAKISPERAARLPVIFDDGVYIIAHEDGTVAVGSTSENEFADPTATDGKLDAVIARARAICPPLGPARIISRWAGLRPRAPRRDPMAGALPDHANVHVLAGGFKTTFGVAHLLADAVLGGIGVSHKMAMPERFSVEAHLAWAAEGLRRRAGV